jgi:hypothetical protein
MIGIPFVYLASFVFLTIRRTGRLARAIQYVAIGAAVVGFVFFFSTDLGLSSNYSDYASSLLSGEAADRGSVAFSSPLSTIAQSGFFGAGLGTATQGAQQLMGHGITWQEDGSGKLFVELGLAGVALFAVALILLIRSGGLALRTFPGESSSFRLQAGLMSVVLGNVASFIISHQAYSGDPASICLVLFCLGIVFALPEVLLPSRPSAAPRGQMVPRGFKIRPF